MANTQSAKKRVRASLRKRDRNRSTRSAAKTLVARARRPGEGDATLTSDEVRRAISALDKAAEKGILHRNNASRRKGRLMRALAKIAPAMIAQGYGRIVNIASIAGKEGNPNAAHYSASKAGLIALTKSLGKELAGYDIAVNAVTPAAAKMTRPEWASPPTIASRGSPVRS